MSQPVQFFTLEQIVRSPRPLHLAIGMYDGVHLGHQSVIESAIHSARRSGGAAGVLTFWPHPSVLINPAKASRMMQTPEMKLRVLARLGVDLVIQQPFTPEFAHIPAEAFLPYLCQRLPHLAGIYVGENWRFGAGRQGDVALLLTEAARQGVTVVSVPRMHFNGVPISSTRIRGCLETGAIEEVNALLGYSYFAAGTVVSGRQLGRTLGFPTLNVVWQPELAPRFGVYAVRVAREGEERFLPAVANYGLRPTVAQGSEPLLETHLLGECPFGNGDRLVVEWLKFIRPERKFGGLEELRGQIAQDSAAAQKFFAEFSLP